MYEVVRTFMKPNTNPNGTRNNLGESLQQHLKFNLANLSSIFMIVQKHIINNMLCYVMRILHILAHKTLTLLETVCSFAYSLASVSYFAIRARCNMRYNRLASDGDAVKSAPLVVDVDGILCLFLLSRLIHPNRTSNNVIIATYNFIVTIINLTYK